MQTLRYYRLVPMLLAILVAVGAWAWYALRPPPEVASGPMLEAIDATGQVRRVAAETARAVRKLADIDHRTTTEDIVRLRTHLNLLDAEAAHLASELQALENSWIPVTEGVALLEECRKTARTSLEKTPSIQVDERTAAQADPKETDPNKTGMTDDARGLLGRGADELTNSSDRLQTRVRQAVVAASFNRGTLLGFAAADVLLILLALAFVLGTATCIRAYRRLRVTPTEAVKQELRELARAQPQRAMTECHQRAGDLLEMAGGIVRGEQL